MSSVGNNGLRLPVRVTFLSPVLISYVMFNLLVPSEYSPEITFVAGSYEIVGSIPVFT